VSEMIVALKINFECPMSRTVKGKALNESAEM
jgi:hypothetical protein